MADISSPNANSSDWNSPYHNQQSANVSTNSPFPGYSNSPYLPPISSTVSPGTLPSIVKDKPEFYDEQEIGPFSTNYSDLTNTDIPVMQPLGGQIQTSHFTSINDQPSLLRPPIAEKDSCSPATLDQRPDVSTDSSVQGLESPRVPSRRRMPPSPTGPSRRSRRLPSSMLGTPSFSKAPPFSSHIEEARRSLRVGRPIAVSTDSSHVETHNNEDEYVYEYDDEEDQEQGEKQEDDNETKNLWENEGVDGDLAPLALGGPAIGKLQQQRRDQAGFGDEQQHQVVDGDRDSGTTNFQDDFEAAMKQALERKAEELMEEARREALLAVQRNRNRYVDSEFEDGRPWKKPPTNHGKKAAGPSTRETPSRSIQSVASFDPAHLPSAASVAPRKEQDAPPASSSSTFTRRDGIPKKNVRFEIPPEHSLHNIDQLIAQSTNAEEIKDLKQQKRLLRNRQAAYDPSFRV
ncbi:BZIP transcription factor [Lasiodiplodia theobromae]|uniref:BZIP transcription factor n=1 Tax=Lasiodiplodia theobromae TaxID=45133 RepID=UPI0015C39734|nr:BZIP transcription factor [Lasiodiplodia theobromae]KAF4540702.1 BZIP transcription factor [Lasiodiplodia theobromae]